MTATNGTACTPESTTPAGFVEDPHGYEETVDYTQRVRLGLRPIALDDSAEDFAHPDPEPCPAWCWVTTDETYKHEISEAYPGYAEHSSQEVAIAASRYRAGRLSGGATAMATLEAKLVRSTKRDPSINLALRHYSADRSMKYDPTRLLLSLDDAQDLVTVLQHLIAQADAAEVLSATSERMPG